jgi:hypothetical protein
MKMFIFNKFQKAILLLLLFMGIVGLFLILPMDITPACACPPIDISARWSLDQLNTIVILYAKDHNGQYPSYEELFLRSDKEGRERLTPYVSMITRTFYLPQLKWGAIGYAVSTDRHDFVLIATGLGKKEIVIFGNIKIHIGTWPYTITPVPYE